MDQEQMIVWDFSYKNVPKRLMNNRFHQFTHTSMKVYELSMKGI